MPDAAGTGGPAILAVSGRPLDPDQTRAVAAPLDAPLVIRGAAGTGKTTALIERLRRIAADAPAEERLWLTTPGVAGTAHLGKLLGDTIAEPRLSCATPAEFALRIVREAQPGAAIFDETFAAVAFETASSELVDEAWTSSEDLDPEVSGIRSPARFRSGAFRLFRKLRAHGIEVEAFEATCRRGLTQFYAHPPNFTSPRLLLRTQEQYRDSLFVDDAELTRQRDREMDLIKVLVAMYRRYLDGVVGSGVTIATEIILTATAMVRAGFVLPARYHVLVDDAQDLCAAELAFIKAVAGASLTLAGDREQATRTFGGRSTKALESPTTVELTAKYRSQALAKYRPSTQALEAKRLAEDVARALASGLEPGRIAVLARGLQGIEPYLDALLRSGIDVEIGGSLDLFAFAPIEDALGALWAVADPYRHDWTMRNLEAPWLNLSDATIAALCADPPDAQALLFELPEEIETSPSRRGSGRGRMLRFGRNFLRGDADAALDPAIRERLAAFRAARQRWESLERSLDLPDLVELVASETVLACAPGGSRGDFERRLVELLVDHARRYIEAAPFASLHDYLLYIEAAGDIEDELVYVAPRDRNAVALFDIETAKGREFSDVFIVNVKAGAFPRWYVPDSFLFYPTLGIVAKENVGEGAGAARTAKFTYAMSDMATREKYCEEERRALKSAIARATARVTVLASGAPTRGISAPELLSEL